MDLEFARRAVFHLSLGKLFLCFCIVFTVWAAWWTAFPIAFAVVSGVLAAQHTASERNLLFGYFCCEAYIGLTYVLFISLPNVIVCIACAIISIIVSQDMSAGYRIAALFGAVLLFFLALVEGFTWFRVQMLRAMVIMETRAPENDPYADEVVVPYEERRSSTGRATSLYAQRGGSIRQLESPRPAYIVTHPQMLPRGPRPVPSRSLPPTSPRGPYDPYGGPQPGRYQTGRYASRW